LPSSEIARRQDTQPTENDISQGLFYLDWILGHRAEFELLVMKNLGSQVAEQIDWSGPRLICVASDFTRYDEYAIAQINRSIELVRHRDYNGAFLTLDLVASTSATATAAGDAGDAPKPARRSTDKTVTQLHDQAPEDLRNLYDGLEAYLLSLGDDVTKTTRQFYYAFRRIKNFVHDDAAFIASRIESRLKNRAELTIRTDSERT
jgi:hypothetical protein